jgi:NDP-sugar pyrophosphorylase family protein
MPAGGEGSRISNLTENKMHKSCLKVKEHSLLYHSISFWSNIDRIILLLRENYSSVLELLKEKEFDNIRHKISISIELEKLGKGGALLNALKYQNINDDDILIIHNPDDIIIKEDSEELLYDFNQSKCDIGIVGVPYTFSPYTGIQYDEKSNKVLDTQQNFKINNPSHVGITFISGKFIKDKMLDNICNFEFENKWFKEEAKNKNVYFIPIDFNNWFPINDIKGYNKFLCS